MERQSVLRESGLGKGDRLGWKSGFGTEGAMSLLGLDQPLLGFLTTATQLGSGSTVDVAEWGVPLLEAEVAVRIGSEIGSGASPEEGAAAIDGVAAAIELVDLGAIDSVEEILAGNIFHRQVLLGEFTEIGATDLAEVRIAVEIDGVRSDPADPRDVIGEIGRVVASLADQAELIGETFQPGDVVITGAAVPPAPVQPGQRYTVEITGDSQVSVEITG